MAHETVLRQKRAPAPLPVRPSLTSRSTWIVGPIYDSIFFLLPPTLAFVLAYAITGTAFDDDGFEFFGYEDVTLAGLFLGIFIHAHIVAVVFRSHANTSVFRTHPWRFVLIPALLYLGFISSSWLLVIGSVLATFWDVYHSGAQTFGFARIYDAKMGNDRNAGRRLDWWFNQVFYAGPIVAGATMIDHFGDFSEFEEVGAAFFTRIPAFMEGSQRYFTWTILGGGTTFLIFYVAAYVRMARKGHKISKQKVFLLTTTGACSIYAWGFNPWGQAFFIMNVFHALQYFGIVWWSEKKTIMKTFGVQQRRYGKQIALVLFVGFTGLYGFWVETVDTDIATLWAITLVVSLMHFWYDGFIWSVRKKQLG